MVRGVLIVVAAGHVRKTEFSSAIAALEKVNAPIAGVVMTFLPSRGPESVGYGTYSYAPSTTP